jgi:prepilin-type N-terminal cleavage/methylation domain-containing protein
MVKSIKNNSGFTLIEILIVIFLFSLITMTGSNLLFSILKTTSKAQIEKEIKQNGNYAISVMEKSIRNARGIDTTGCVANQKQLTITNQDGSQTLFRCFDNESVAKIASDSSPLTNANVTVGTPGQLCTSSSLTFECQSTSFPPLVKISFTLKQAKANPSVENQASVFFQTTVSLRTY